MNYNRIVDRRVNMVVVRSVQVLAEMSTDHLIDMILTIPTVYLKPSLRDTGFTASYMFNPLTNMQYTRDQQITTAKVRCVTHLMSVFQVFRCLSTVARERISVFLP
jgi:arginine deiminase